MPLTATRPDTGHDVLEAPPFSREWHEQQDADERAWLDDWARTQQLPTTN